MGNLHFDFVPLAMRLLSLWIARVSPAVCYLDFTLNEGCSAFLLFGNFGFAGEIFNFFAGKKTVPRCLHSARELFRILSRKTGVKFAFWCLSAAV